MHDINWAGLAFCMAMTAVVMAGICCEIWMGGTK